MNNKTQSRKKNTKKLLILILLILTLTTGCTKTLVDKNKKAIKNEETGQNLTENILCQPTNKKSIAKYKENKVGRYEIRYSLVLMCKHLILLF